MPDDLPGVSHPSGSPQVHITFPDGKRRLASIKQPATLQELVAKRIPDTADLMFLLNGSPAEPDEGIYYDDTLLPEPPHKIVVQVRGRGGGSDSQARLRIQKLLEAKGLQGPELQEKLDHTMEVLTKAELSKFVESPDPWKTLKNLVGTRVMFLKKSSSDTSGARGSKDPWLESDPWKEAAQKNKREGHQTPVLKLIPEAFANADGTIPEVLDKLCHGTTGITLITPQTFLEWADVAMPMSADELSAVVFPPVAQDKIPAGLKITTVEFPAVIQGDRETTSLLRGNLVHFGSKEIALSVPRNQTTLTTKDAVSLLVEATSDHVPDWGKLAASPMQYLSSRLKTFSLLSHWGARMWAGKTRTFQSHNADRFTTNILVPRDALPQILRMSGVGGIWFSPRSGQPEFEKYGILWVPGNLSEVQTSHDKHPDAMGVVRSRKGFGIRFPKDSMAAAKQLLTPGIPFHAAVFQGVDPNLLFKISPTPLGAGRDDVQDYLSKQPELSDPKVIRQIGPKGWLVAFSKVPGRLFFFSGGSHIILQQWVTKGDRDPLRSAVIVGNNASVKAALQGWGAPGDLQRAAPVMEPALRPPPQGPTQDKLSQMESKLTKMVEEVREGCRKEIQMATDTHSEKILEVQKMTKIEVDKLRAEQTTSHEELKQLSHDTRQETQKKMDALDQTMSTGFQKMMEEFHRMKQKDLKRNASPSPDGESQKILKN